MTHHFFLNLTDIGEEIQSRIRRSSDRDSLTEEKIRAEPGDAGRHEEAARTQQGGLEAGGQGRVRGS